MINSRVIFCGDAMAVSPSGQKAPVRVYSMTKKNSHIPWFSFGFYGIWDVISTH